tara:strand:+ start:55 stop:615 length:561 start_codon:yes stop_codon:yes gene_type:complete
MADLIQAPIPGQSLTGTPKNVPWEKPSELNEVKEVINHYVEKLADQDTMDDIAILFELGADLKTVTEGLWLTGSMSGLHTVETGMLAGPVVSSFIRVAMKSYGIDAPEESVSPNERAKEREMRRLEALIGKMLEDTDREGGDPGVELIEEIGQAVGGEAPVEEESMEMEQPETMDEPTGLMSRGAV